MAQYRAREYELLSRACAAWLPKGRKQNISFNLAQWFAPVGTRAPAELPRTSLIPGPSSSSQHCTGADTKLEWAWARCFHAAPLDHRNHADPKEHRGFRDDTLFQWGQSNYLSQGNTRRPQHGFDWGKNCSPRARNMMNSMLQSLAFCLKRCTFYFISQ